jgi:hypothetical protein
VNTPVAGDGSEEAPRVMLVDADDDAAACSSLEE